MSTAIFLLPFPLLLASPATSPVGAQPYLPTNGAQHPYSHFSPSTAIIIVVLIAALYFMGVFSIYIRPCSDSPVGARSVRRAISAGSPRVAAARGLDVSVIESFPMLSYLEVKDHQIGMGSLECAICLNSFEDDETLRFLPQCDHIFHPECIGAWLVSHVTCPVCRANLSPLPTSEDQLSEMSLEPDPSTSGEVILQVVEDSDRSESLSPPSVAVFGGSGKFKSHSTGHSTVYLVENLERFTLRLPVQVKKEVMDRTSLSRTVSVAAASLPSSRSSSRARFYRRIERKGRSLDQWSFPTRSMSDEGGSGQTLIKMPSLKCLKPKVADDETGLFFPESASHSV